VRFIDLGSRNGSWIGKEKAKEAELKPGDTVRMGSLLITYAYDPPPPPPPPPKPAPDESATVLLPAKPLIPPPKADEERTVLLNREKPKAPDPATALMRPKEPSSPPSSVKPDTARLGPDVLPPPAAPSRPVATLPESDVAIDDTFPKSSWTARHALVVLAVAFTVYLVLALPLVRTLGNALREESLRRGRALLDLLTAANTDAVAEGRARDLEVEMVTREERVKEAFLLDLQGKVLAPSSRANETFTSFDGIEQPLGEIRTFHMGRRRNGDYVMVEPILDRGKRVGLSVLVYEVATASGGSAAAVLFLALLMMMLAVLVAVVLGKRFTLAPIGALRDDVEAVVKGDAPRVPLAQAFPELTDVARSVNRIVERATVLAKPTVSLRSAAEAAISRPAPAPSSTRALPVPHVAAAKGPSSAATASGDGALFWVDGGFIVIHAEPAAATLLGGTPEAVQGKHVIEAVKDEKVLGAVLDALNALEEAPGTPVSVVTPSGTLEIRATREGDRVAVSLKPNA
jgi:PAS domain-containing protein